MRPYPLLLFTFSLFCLIAPVHGLKVIIYQLACAKSHVDFTKALIQILTEEGHTVDVIFSRLNTRISLELLNTTIARRTLVVGHNDGGSPWDKSAHLTSPFAKDTSTTYQMFLEAAYATCRKALETDDAENFIKGEHYDIAVTADLDYCGHILFHKAGISSVVSHSAMPLLPESVYTAGLPTPASSFTPLKPFVDPNSMWSRLKNSLNLAEALYYKMSYTAEYNKIARAKYGPDFIDVEQLGFNLDVIFVNSNQILETARPIAHKLKYIGGIALKKPKPLTKEMDQVLSKASRGNVIIAFGTQVSTKSMSFELRRHFVRSFNQFPEFTFIWRYDEMPDDEVLFANSTNVERITWLPQIDMLNDKRVVGFITHAGMNSFLEASFAGVPMVAIPIFADQPHNAHCGKTRGTTVVIDKTNINEETLTEALKQILYDASYMRSAKKAAKLMRENPEQGREVFLKWINFAANNKGLHKYNTLPGSDLTPITYYCLDIAAMAFIVALLCLYFSFKLLIHAYRYVFSTVTLKLKTH